ncbi:MAG: hypothetical protein JW774_09330, partial [Candidatus Aureabacteria bacterium]|nr:hypothetical protein [Candidatus Auribacterota bacterium]
NLYLRSKKTFHLEAIIKTADWLVSHLRRNGKGLLVWFHEFDFEYFQLLKNPWYSGLAQGQAISFLLRAHEITDNQKYIQCALDASLSLQTKIEDGGVLFHDDLGGTWIEEYITHPPVHILNGFIWALWGVYDLCQTTSDARLKELYRRLEQNLCTHLERYDTGYWSRYDLSPLRLINPASRFYHQLHCIQLEIMHRLTGKEKYRLFSEKWRTYQTKRMNRISACFKKCVFKVLYY